MVDEREDTKEEPKEETVRDTLEAAFEETESATDEPNLEENAQEEEVKDEAPEDAESVDESADEPEDTDLDQEEQEQVDDEVEEESVSPPSSWSNKEKEIFSSLPAAAKEVISRREEESNNYLLNKGRELAEEKRNLEAQFAPYHEIGEVVAQYQENYGVPLDTQYLDTLLKGDRALQSRNPETRIDAACRVLESVGLHPEDLLDYMDGYGTPQYNNGPVENDASQQRIQKLETAFQQQQAAATDAEAHNFAFERNEDGDYLRPFLHDPLLRDGLLQKMAPKIQALTQGGTPLGRAYQEAYDESIWAIPQIREQLIETVPKKKQGLKTQRQKVEESKRMSTSIKSSVAKPPPPKGPETVREAVEDAFNKHVG